VTDEERHPLEISEEVARAAGVPDDLDATQREPYTIPTTRRRRTAAIVYFVGAALAAAGIAAGLPAGLWVIAGVMVAIGLWHALAAWRIEILDPEALDIANRAVQFPVGHASAAIGFDGWRARPIWNVLVFSADEPPSQRGLVRVDAVTGEVVETYTEEVVSAES
jgi:hypothetical protein